MQHTPSSVCSDQLVLHAVGVARARVRQAVVVRGGRRQGREGGNRRRQSKQAIYGQTALLKGVKGMAIGHVWDTGARNSGVADGRCHARAPAPLMAGSWTGAD